MSYYLAKTLPIAFDEAVIRVTAALKQEGFGVLTDIDVQTTLKSKLGVDTPKYRILGACNPAFAHEALKSPCACREHWKASDAIKIGHKGGHDELAGIAEGLVGAPRFGLGIPCTSFETRLRPA